MPNTEVKLLNVDDTWWVTAWEAIKGDYFFVSHLFCFEKLGSNSKRCKCTSDTIAPFFVTKIYIKMIDQKCLSDISDVLF